MAEKRNGGPRNLSADDREVLKPFSEALLGMYERVAALAPEGRAVLRASAKRTSQTNCGWHEYEAATIALDALYTSEAKASVPSTTETP